MSPRKHRDAPLKRPSLTLVLCQVRFSPIRLMDKFIPEIQEAFRQHRFPIERAGKVKQFTFGPEGEVPQEVEQQRWEYRTEDGAWNVLVQEGSVVVQTTARGAFHEFADRLRFALRTVLATTRHDLIGVVERVGLRVVDAVRPRDGENFRAYLRPGFHGADDKLFQAGTNRLLVESVGETEVRSGLRGTMIVRVAQNHKGLGLPAELVASAPPQAVHGEGDELMTLIDLDHFIDGIFAPDADWVVARAFDLHERINDAFYQHVVSETALEAWQ